MAAKKTTDKAAAPAAATATAAAATATASAATATPAAAAEALTRRAIAVHMAAALVQSPRFASRITDERQQNLMVALAASLADKLLAAEAPVEQGGAAFVAPHAG